MKFLTAPALSGLDSIRHGFFTRQGGVSTGIYESLNCGLGSDDSPDNVAQNREIVARHFGFSEKRLLTANQCHTADVIINPLPMGEGRVRESENIPSPVSLTLADLSHKGEVMKADAMVTDKPGFGLGILTADCAPVLFADPEAKVIGAAHAGWKGALGGVLENTIAAMEGLGATRKNIHAALGPCIHQPSYEVTSEFREKFVTENQSFGAFFQSAGKPGHLLFDLPGFVLYRLQAACVQTENLGRDTYVEPDLFFSYRRATHRGEPDYGRQIAVISMFI